MTRRSFPVPPLASTIGALRWSLVIVFLFFGVAKFAEYEAKGVAGIAGHHPVFAWIYTSWGPRVASDTIGVIELVTAACLAVGAWSPRLSLVGGLMGICTFVITLSFMIGATIWQAGYGAPFIGSLAQFLLKDLVLLAGCYAIAVASARRAGLAPE